MGASFAEGLVGITLDGRYRLDAVLGEGGMGAVFRATHLAMDRKVAVKLLKPHLTTNEASARRFAREARSTMKVDSPHAVKVLDYGVTPHRDYYMVLEYLDGRTVQRELDVDGVFAPSRVLHIARQALHALGAAHAMGLVHRDIKPENVLLMRVGSDPDYTKLLDFGVAKLMEGAAKSAESHLALTQIGTVFGTPEFMSPEQACGHPLDGRSDLYSLAATMFAMLTGCGLFEAASAIEWLTSHVRTPPPHLADVRPELVAYPELDELLQCCLAKHRDQRPRTAASLDEMLARLEPVVAARPPGRAPGSSSKVRVFSSSMFFEPLPLATHDPGETRPAEARPGETRPAEATPARPTRASAPTLVKSSTSDLLAAVRPSRRGLYLGLGALGVLGAAATAVGISLGSSGTAPVGRDATLAVAPVAEAGPAPAVDAAPAPVDAAPEPPPAPDARPAAPDDRVPDDRATGADRDPRIRRPSPPRGAREHLRRAEQAFQAGQHMKQLAEADLALRADPRNLRAKYLLGDALIKYGDLVRGCAYLRALGRNALAIKRAKAAGCRD